MNRNKRILFGINADPPHLGHRHVIHELEKALGQNVHFVVMPAGVHPFKKSQVGSKEDRFNMAKLLFSGYAKVIVDDYEIKKEKESFTIDTLKHLKAIYPDDELYFVMAIDAANHFYSWHKPKEILSLARPIIVNRVGYQLEPMVEKKLRHDTSPIILDTTSLDISSTQIRNDLKMSHFSPDLSKEVLDYIHAHKLYQ